MRAESGLRAAIDTHVWISAFLKKTSVPARIMHRIMAEGQPVFSQPTFAELEARLWLPKFDRYSSMEDRKVFIHDASSLAHWVDIAPDIATRTFCRDADDDKFIHAALAAKAPLLVTGDKDLLDVPETPGLRILSPADALRMLEGRH